ncbi:MAG: acyl carrier protein [Terriglobales bacterium]|jgi:acyl carrier protein
MQQIEQEVRQFVIENFIFDNNHRNFSNDDSFFDTGLLDSMGVLTLVDFVNEKYGIPIEDDELLPENWDSVNRIATFVRARFSPAIDSQDNSAQNCIV